MNKVWQSGNLGRDIEVRADHDGTLIGEFSLAMHDYDGRDGDGKPIYVTTWVNAVIVGDYVRKVQDALCKGRPVRISGRLRSRSRKIGEGEFVTLHYVEVERGGLEFDADWTPSHTSKK